MDRDLPPLNLGNPSLLARRKTRAIYEEIRAERERAHAKHGDNSMEGQSPVSMFRMTILMEEVGEVAREFNEHALGNPMDWDALRAELIQVAAMAAAWAESISNPPTEFAHMVQR